MNFVFTYFDGFSWTKSFSCLRSDVLQKKWCCFVKKKKQIVRYLFMILTFYAMNRRCCVQFLWHWCHVRGTLKQLQLWENLLWHFKRWGWAHPNHRANMCLVEHRQQNQNAWLRGHRQMIWILKVREFIDLRRKKEKMKIIQMIRVREDCLCKNQMTK